ncbi:hypothetical protein D3C78_1374340 [compost metagenome]
MAETGAEGQQAGQPLRAYRQRGGMAQAPQLATGEPQDQHAEAALEQRFVQVGQQQVAEQRTEQHAGQDGAEQQRAVDLRAVAPDQVAGHADIQRHQHRQQLVDRQQQGAERQGDNDAAETGDGLQGVGQQDKGAQRIGCIDHQSISAAKRWLICR